METMEMIGRAQQGDKMAREALVINNMGLVYSIVRRFSNRGYEQEDLCQIGSIGLIKAIDKFDVTFEVKFSTYAVPMITGEIKRFLRDDGMIKVSRSLKEIATKARVAGRELSKEYGREATLKEISSDINIPTEEIAMAMEAVSDVESLSKSIYQGDGNPISLMERIEGETGMESTVVDHVALEKVMEELEERDREIIHLRYFMEKTQNDIAKKMGISQVQVSRLEKRILLRMRERLSFE